MIDNKKELEEASENLRKSISEHENHACPKLKNALGKHTSDRDSEIENIAEKE